jgi:hypothetical protein
MMKLSTNYSIHANICHASYYHGDESITFYTVDDEQIEINGVERDDMIRLARNYLVVDLVKSTPTKKLTEQEVASLKEIKDALTTYLQDNN